MSGRAAAQLQHLGYSDVHHYLRGKADWMVRGLPAEPGFASISERVRAMPYFVNNLAPGLRDTWIALSRRLTVSRFTDDTLPRLAPGDSVENALVESAAGQAEARLRVPSAVVLDSSGVLLGSIEQARAGQVASDVMNPAPQTIRPDMTLALAARLLRSHPYLLVTDAIGRYVGMYHRRGD